MSGAGGSWDDSTVATDPSQIVPRPPNPILRAAQSRSPLPSGVQDTSAPYTGPALQPNVQHRMDVAKQNADDVKHGNLWGPIDRHQQEYGNLGTEMALSLGTGGLGETAPLAGEHPS